MFREDGEAVVTAEAAVLITGPRLVSDGDTRIRLSPCVHMTAAAGGGTSKHAPVTRPVTQEKRIKTCWCRISRFMSSSCGATISHPRLQD